MRKASTTYIAFLRAINVAGHAIVKMTDLRDAFEAAGCSNVRTFIQSGNVVFESSTERSGIVFEDIRRELQDLIGSDPQLMFRTLDDLQTIQSKAPFKNLEPSPRIKRYVVFLAEKPHEMPSLPLISEKERLEAIAMTDLEVFIVSHPKPNGFFGFPNNFIEKELGVLATSRNWSTVTKISEFASRGQSSRAVTPPK